MVDHARAAARERYLVLVIADLITDGVDPLVAVNAAPFELVDEDAPLWKRVDL